jgi:hypothetical protein
MADSTYTGKKSFCELYKVCIVCKQEKDWTCLTNDSRGNQKSSICKQCKAERHRKWYLENSEKRKTQNIERKNRLKAEGKLKGLLSKYRKAQRERYIAQGLTTNGTPRKQKPVKPKDELRPWRTKYSNWHRQWLREAAPNGCAAAWYKGTGKPWNNPRLDSGEKFKIRYNSDNEFRAREILKAQYRKKARAERVEAQSDGTLTPKALGALFAEARFCSYCMEPFEGYKDKTADHVEPLYSGGKHSIENIVIACLSCNSSKGKKGLIEWLIAAKPTSNSNA